MDHGLFISVSQCIYSAVPSLVWVHCMFLELNLVTYLICDFSKVLQKSWFSTIQRLFEKESPRTEKKAEPKGNESLQQGKLHCQMQGILFPCRVPRSKHTSADQLLWASPCWPAKGKWSHTSQEQNKNGAQHFSGRTETISYQQLQELS